MMPMCHVVLDLSHISLILSGVSRARCFTQCWSLPWPVLAGGPLPTRQETQSAAAR